VDREGLWFRVLAALYVIEGGRLRAGGWGRFSWWKEITRIREGGERGADGLRSMLRGGWGTGQKRFSGPTPDDRIPLSERFDRLFDLAETKWCTVAEMFLLGWGVEAEAWVWRRQLRWWEEE
jgi:hypothetical protein